MHIAAPRILSASARRRFVATLAGAATALALMTAAAAPARADSGRDLATAIAAVAAIAIIAKAADNRKKRDQAAPAPTPEPVWHRDHGPRHDRGWDRNARRLPAECAIEFPGHRGRTQVVYPEPCLRRAGVQGWLPRGCEEFLRIRGRHVPVYPERCLIDAGFRPDPARGLPYPHRPEPRHVAPRAYSPFPDDSRPSGSNR